MEVRMEQEKKTFITPFIKQCYVTCSVCCSSLATGCINGYSAVLLPQLTEEDSIIKPSIEEASWIASIGSISILFGSWFTPWLMNSYGRKVTQYFCTFFAILGWMFIIFTQNVLFMIIGRTLHGFAFGVIIPLRPALMGEYSSPKYRGAFLGMLIFSMSLGNTLVHLIGSITDWQKTAMMSSGFLVLSLVMIVVCPESPSYLAYKGRYDECKKVFRWLRGDEEEKELAELIESQIYQKQMKLDNENTGVTRIIQIFKKKEFYKPVIVMFFCNFLLFSGFATMSSYSTMILGNILGQNSNVSFWMVFIDTEAMLLGLTAVYVINRFKRRDLMFSSGAVCILSHIGISAYVLGFKTGFIPEIQWFALSLVVLQFASVTLGLFPLPAVLAGELFPLEHRGLAGSVNAVTIALISTVMLKTFPSLVFAVGIEGTYAIYAGILFFSLLFLWFLMPETKGKTLQEIEESFKGTIRDCKEEKLTSVDVKYVLASSENTKP